MYNKPIIVVGSGRSGTSMVAGMLHYLGVHMGNSFVPADRNNPAGYFEDEDVKNLNLQFLNKKIKEEKFKKAVRGYVLNKSTSYRRWGFKVPSTANLLGYWLDALEGMDEVKVVYCKRPKRHIKNSMRKAYDWEDDKIDELVDNRLDEIKRCKKEYNIDWLEIDFKDIVSDSEGTVNRLIEFGDLKSYDEEIETAILSVGKKTKWDHEHTEKPFVYTVVYNLGWVRREVAGVVANLTHDERVEMSLEFPEAKPYSLNINQTMHKMLEHPANYDYLMMMDADNPPRRNPFDLIELDKDVMVFPTPTIKKGKLIYTINDDVGGRYKPIPEERQKGLVRVDSGGSGAMLIARRVVEAMKDNPWKGEWLEEGRKRRTGDYNFCSRVREKGFNIWAHFDYKCGHIKEVDLSEVK